MDRAFQRLIEYAKEELIKDSRKIREADKMASVSGTRHKLLLNRRDIDMVYYPARSEDGSLTEGKAPLIVGYHGGGFVMGGCALDDAMWTAVTSALNVNVASIGYRLSPEFQWKESLADAFDAVLYLRDHAGQYGFDEGHISVMGQSAGGNLAAAVSILANLDKSITLDNVILIYPFLDVYTEPNKKGAGSLAGPVCYAMNQLHCDYVDTLNPLVSPVYATADMLKGMPNTIIDYCSDDNLKDEAVTYANMLKKAGVTVHERLAAGMPHGYFESGFKEPTEYEMNHLLGENGPRIVSDGSLAGSARECLDFLKENFLR